VCNNQNIVSNYYKIYVSNTKCSIVSNDDSFFRSDSSYASPYYRSHDKYDFIIFVMRMPQFSKLQMIMTIRFAINRYSVTEEGGEKRNIHLFCVL